MTMDKNHSLAEVEFKASVNEVPENLKLIQTLQTLKQDKGLVVRKCD